MVIVANLGFPRMGPKRELKKALEKYWAGRIPEKELFAICRNLRKNNWLLQKELGFDHIPSGDFSLYDHVLDTIAMVGAIPERYGANSKKFNIDTYFAMARGIRKNSSAKATGGADSGVKAMEMTKWFDTNYHYIVPELKNSQNFRPCATTLVDEFLEAKNLGIKTRPVLLGPVSFLLLGKSGEKDFHPISLLEKLLPVYGKVLQRLSSAGADWVQMDEPFLALDLDENSRNAFKNAYGQLAKMAPNIKILLASYFGGLGENLPMALNLPVSALHLDLVRAPEQLEPALKNIPKNLSLSLGVVNGRNVWRTYLDEAFVSIKRAVIAIGTQRVMVSPSCSLIHVPVDLDFETGIDPELRLWLSFAKQKLEEVAILAKATENGFSKVESEFAESRAQMERRRDSPHIHNEPVKRRLAGINGKMSRRRSNYEKRMRVQRKQLELPIFPTTTIGSFPQTKEVRRARADFKSGKIDAHAYNSFMREKIKRAILFQEEIGIDVLAHGEFERNDMVEYFGERLSGFAITKNGWVQSYGSRCTKPPIIYGDVQRKGPMTVELSKYAQSLTKKPVKGMLTGPVTILQWSFARDDQPRAETCKQIALAIRDETLDLEAAGIRVIQIDEPALREGLPLKRAEWDEYLSWAVEAFRISAGGVKDATQIHTHMCYSEFNDIIEHISAMDADVISIEASRSHMEILDVFTNRKYSGEVGPGIYDIHSPRVPPADEMEELLHKAIQVLSPSQIWVNPDCGLKTRNWDEVRPALTAMVKAAENLRNFVDGVSSSES